MGSAIGLNDLTPNLLFQVTKYRYIHDNMGDSFILKCENRTTLEYVIVAEGFVFDYLKGIIANDNAITFTLIRAQIPETGGYSFSINEDYNWITLR